MNTHAIFFRIIRYSLLLSLFVGSSCARAQEELEEALEGVSIDLKEAKREREVLKQRVEVASQRVELLTELKRLHRQLATLHAELEEAERNGEEDTLEEIEEEFGEAEFRTEFLEAKRAILDARNDLLGLIAEIPIEADELVDEGQRLRRLTVQGEELIEQMFEAWADDREEEAGEFEDQFVDFEETFERRRERLDLRVELLHAENEGDEEWIREIEEALEEFEDLNGDEGEGRQRRSEKEAAAVPKMPPPLEFSDEELTTVAKKSFGQDIVPLLNSACYGCHDGDSASGDLNIESLVKVQPLVKKRRRWVNIIQQLRVRSMPPPDADPMPEADRRTLTAWLTNAIERFDYGRVRQPGYEPARRLTHEEYNNTIRDLFGVDLRPADRFPADMKATSGFDNSSNSLFIQPVLLERYLGAAEYVVENILGDEKAATEEIVAMKRAAGLKLAPREFLARFASRAFRRPVSDTEVDRLVQHFESQVASGRTPQQALQDVVQVVLISPSFLIRAEADSQNAAEAWRISNYELASRLSYFLWASMPDEELFEAAESGNLHDPVVLRQHVERMLSDRKAETLGSIFAGQWLQFSALDRVQRDQIDNPWATDSLVDAMKEESAMLFNSVVADNASIDRLIDADYTFVNEELARHYRMNGVQGEKLQRVSLTNSPRRGIMGHGSILAVTSFPGRTSPVVRGNWILSELLGTPPPPPPPNVSEFDERVLENERLTARRKLELHRNNPNCYGCHSQIDPLGFALEEFEWFGRHQARRRGKSVDTTAQLPEGTQFKGLKGLTAALVSERIGDLTFQVTRKMLSYALGRQLDYYDEATVRDLVAQMHVDDRKIRTLIHGITQSETFLMKQK